MKIMIISDIHGDIDSLNKIIDLYKNDNYEHLIILGDLELNSKMGEILANFEKNITIVRGNCDLPIYDKYLNKKLYDIYVNKLNGFFCYFYHGHKGIPNIEVNDQTICFSGHTHIGSITNMFSVIYANPGSISRPRNNLKSFIEFNEKSIILRSFNDNRIIKKLDI